MVARKKTEKAEAPKLDAGSAMAGVLALLVAEREERLERARSSKKKKEPRKTEVVLARAGLSYGEIAALTGKRYDAVKQTVRRASH